MGSTLQPWFQLQEPESTSLGWIWLCEEHSCVPSWEIARIFFKGWRSTTFSRCLTILLLPLRAFQHTLIHHHLSLGLWMKRCHCGGSEVETAPLVPGYSPSQSPVSSHLKEENQGCFMSCTSGGHWQSSHQLCGFRIPGFKRHQGSAWSRSISKEKLCWDMNL